MHIASVSRIATMIHDEAGFRRKVALGELMEKGLEPEEKEALTRLARRIQENQELPVYLRRAPTALWWLAGPEPLGSHQG